HQFFGDGPRELLRIREQCLAQTGKPLEPRSTDRRPAGFHAVAGFVDRSPAADDVEVLERKSQRVDDGVAARARWILAVLIEPFADRFRRRPGLVVDVRVDAGRGWRD